MTIDSPALFSRSVKLLLAFASTVIPSFIVLGIHSQDFYSLLDMYLFQNAASYSAKVGPMFLCRRYICYPAVPARVYPCCHGDQVSMDSVHHLSPHYTNNYTRYYAEVLLSCRLQITLVGTAYKTQFLTLSPCCVLIHCWRAVFTGRCLVMVLYSGFHLRITFTRNSMFEANTAPIRYFNTLLTRGVSFKE